MSRPAGSARPGISAVALKPASTSERASGLQILAIKRALAAPRKQKDRRGSPAHLTSSQDPRGGRRAGGARPGGGPGSGACAQQ